MMGESMAEGNARRRLAAVLAADVAGYTRLMEADEEATLAAWWAARRDVIDPGIDAHGGRIVKHTGDGFLAEFATATDAVRCAVAMQTALAERNVGAADERRFDFRIGVNLGEIVVDDEDIYGAGVNIAARIEALADPGGISISGTVHEQVRNKLDFAFADLGEQSVKNVSAPVRVWKWLAETGTPLVDVSAPVPGFDGRPAIAVLPFENLSGDAEQEYFADGIAEDILTRLAMWRWLPVIARNSSFTYKGQALDVKRVGAELGARYVLEGSVRKAGNRVRVTGQLIDAGSGHHIWAERYDRDLEDIFAVQDEITEAIVAALEPAVGRAEMQRAHRKDPGNLDAWDLFQRGMWHFNKLTKEEFAVAVDLMRQAIAIDTEFAHPHSGLAVVRIVEALLTWAENPAEALAEAHAEALCAAGHDGTDPLANAVLGYSNAFMRRYEDGTAAARRALELNPSFALAYHSLGVISMVDGRPEDAVQAIERALRISPNDDWLPVWFATLSASHYMAHDYEKALEAAKLSVQRAPHYPLGQRALAGALAQLGRMGEARRALDEFVRLSPNYSTDMAKRSAPFRDDVDFEHYMAGLRLAGLPE